MPDRARARLKWLARILVSVAIVAWILVDVDRADLLRAIGRVRSDLLAAAAALFVAGTALNAWKWSLLGRSVGLERRVSEYVRFYFVGLFFNLFGLSTLGGDVIRALYLGGGRRFGRALNSVVFDRLSGLAFLLVLGAGALLLFPGYGFPKVLTTTVVALGAAPFLAWWLAPRCSRLLPAGNRVRRLVEDDLEPFWGDTRLLLTVAAVSLVFHLTQVSVQWVLSRAVGIGLPFSYCLIMHPMLSVMIALPVSVGGFGVREGGYLYFLTRLGVDGSAAVTMGLLWFAVTAASGLVGGLVFLASGAELPRLRAPAADGGAAVG
jgi:uncharacterized membrane protein YbhN (UPF0104 family)